MRTTARFRVGHGCERLARDEPREMDATCFVMCHRSEDRNRNSSMRDCRHHEACVVATGGEPFERSQQGG
jgi:hypothetical protein